MFIVILYVSTIILCKDLGMLIVSNRLISIRIVTLLTSEVITVTMHTLLDTIKVSVHTSFALNSLTLVNSLIAFKFSCLCTTLHISVYIFQLSLRNKLSKVKIVSVLNYTKINHYAITLVQVFWNSAQIS